GKIVKVIEPIGGPAGGEGSYRAGGAKGWVPMEPVLLISSDCHGGDAAPAEYQDYLEREDFDELPLDRRGGFDQTRVVETLSRHPFFHYPDEILHEYRDQLDERQAWAYGRAAERLGFLEQEGYVAEVVFPDGVAPFSPFPFGGFGVYAGLDARALELALA